jgi:phosphate transport system substrate-binding protein
MSLRFSGELANTLAPMALALVLALPTHAQEVAAEQTADADVRNAVSFRPSPLQPGTLRIWGQEQMSAVVKYWTEGFCKFHPEIVIEPRLMGSASAVPGLYAGLADIALLGRKNNITDDNGFSRPKGYTFQRFELTRGSLDVEGKSPALAVLVNRDNPVSKLTLRQLAAVAACGCREGVREARTWGQLGVAGRWARMPVHLYIYDAESGTGLFFLDVILNNSRKLAWERVRDFKNVKRVDGSVERASEQIVAALYKDPYGLAVSNLRYASERLKQVAIAATDFGPYELPTRETIIARSYPLARSTYAMIDQPPGKPVDPKVREFLRYTLSAEGQADVLRDGGYLPLDNGTLSAQLRKLDP